MFVTHAVVTRAFVVAGNDKQKKHLLPSLTSGSRLAAFAATELASGANPFAIATKARADGSDFVVNGTKTFIAGAGEAEVYLVLMRTDKAQQVHGGTGYSRELPLERLYRDARGLTLHLTPSETLKGMLGKMLMGMPPF